MTKNFQAVSNKLYEITSPCGNSLGYWFYYGSTFDAHIFHLDFPYGIEMAIPKEQIAGFKIA